MSKVNNCNVANESLEGVLNCMMRTMQVALAAAREGQLLILDMCRHTPRCHQHGEIVLRGGTISA